MIAFTGAGISTAAGIPDFRSGTDTVLKTGAGKWEIEAHNKTAKPAQKLQSRASADAMKTAFPTYTHMALKTLIEHGYLKCLVSQTSLGGIWEALLCIFHQRLTVCLRGCLFVCLCSTPSRQ